MNKPLTKAQRAALAFFDAKKRGVTPAICSLDPRTLAALRDKGFIEPNPGLYGPTHRITPAGVAALNR